MRTTTCDLLTELNALRLTHHLCDVALCVNGTLIYAHRVVLAAARYYLFSEVVVKKFYENLHAPMSK